MKKPRCQHCNKAMTYNKILGIWECRNCECLVTRVSSELVSSIQHPPVGIVARAIVPAISVGLLDVSAKTAKPVKGSDKEIKSPQK